MIVNLVVQKRLLIQSLLCKNFLCLKKSIMDPLGRSQIAETYKFYLAESMCIPLLWGSISRQTSKGLNEEQKPSMNVRRNRHTADEKRGGRRKKFSRSIWWKFEWFTGVAAFTHYNYWNTLLVLTPQHVSAYRRCLGVHMAGWVRGTLTCLELLPVHLIIES